MLNVGSVQMVPNETIGEALRRAEAALIAKRDEARRGEPVSATRAREADAESEIDPGEDLAPTPSALMSLIPVGEAILRR
jgi:hypothetical protein